MSILYGKQRMTSSATLIDILEQKAREFPNKQAIKCGTEILTYAEVVNAVSLLASQICSFGFKEETLVGIYMDRSEKMVISLLAVLKAGCAYVPLDPEHPYERNKYIIDKANIALLISETKYSNAFDMDGEVLFIDEIWRNFNVNDVFLFDSRQKGGNQLSYVIFTSGSTGEPKGVQIEHEGMMNYLLSVSDNLRLDENERGLSVVTITFDISISEMFLPLINGATLIIAENSVAKDGVELVKLFEKEKITLCGFTPSTAYMLLEAGIKELNSVKMLIGGEPWNISLAQSLLDKGCEDLWNVYGPTETTIYSTMCHITKEDRCISIGTPIDQTDIYVLNQEMNPVLEEEEGELYIGGIGVARGYLNNEELTNKRFIINPIDPGKGKIYRTGDIVKILNNRIVYVGRSDFQVKVHGYRIELGEIETTIMKHEQVLQAVVVVVGENAEAILKAYIKLKEGAEINSLDMKSFVEKYLPHYMIPNTFSFVDNYPMTANLKVDRKKLMEFDYCDDVIDDEYVAPRNEIEEMIAEIWMDLLNINRVSVKDDFLIIGGHSLLANRLLNRVNKMFETTIKLVELFSGAITIENIAILVENNLLDGLSEEEIEALLNGEEY